MVIYIWVIYIFFLGYADLMYCLFVIQQFANYPMATITVSSNIFNQNQAEKLQPNKHIFCQCVAIFQCQDIRKIVILRTEIGQFFDQFIQMRIIDKVSNRMERDGYPIQSSKIDECRFN